MTNVDQQEINKFSELASRWWDPEGEFKPLHLINPLRLDFINQHSEGLFDKKVVDIGCGGGILAESMAGRGSEENAAVRQLGSKILGWSLWSSRVLHRAIVRLDVKHL